LAKGRRKRSSKRHRNQCGKIACVKNELEKIDVLNAKQSIAFIDSSCLVKRTIRRVMTFRKT